MTQTIGRTKIRQDEVNSAAKTAPAPFFEECDRHYEKQIEAIVQRVSENVGGAKLILLSGPSASGKTTSSFKIKQGLLKHGIQAMTISMDDFFKDRVQMLNETAGEPDFESLEALDLPLLKNVLNALISKGQAKLPSFDFKTGSRRSEMIEAQLKDGDVAIIEGLHALDTRVTEGIPSEHMLKIYISVSSDFVDAGGSLALCARDLRLIRRTIRDYHFRGSSPDNTLGMWDSVCRGEDRYIRPFKRYADITVNSVFRCEPCLFRESAIRLFSMVEPQSVHYEKASRMIAGLSAFAEMPLALIPGSSVLREFIGGSDYFNKSGKIRTVQA